MSIPQTTPFSLFLHENMDLIRTPFMSPNEVYNIAEEIWDNMPHELKFSYFKKAHDLFAEKNQRNISTQDIREIEKLLSNQITGEIKY
jgi:hypothetical protein